jgi:alpha-beta hydrolase superfamily lysophospholipase
MHRLLAPLAASLAVAACAVAAIASPAHPPDGTYRYTLTVAGASAGTSTVVIRTTADAVTVDDRSEVEVMRLSGHAVTRYDAATLRLSGYSGDFTVAGNPQHVDVDVAAGALTVRGGGTRATIAADPSAPLELLADNLTGTMIVVPAALAASHAQRFTLAPLAPPKPIVVTVANGTAPARPAGIPAGDVALVVDLAGIGLREVYWYDPASFVVDAIVIPAQNAEYRLVGRDASVSLAPPPAQTPAPTPLPTAQPHFHSEDVSFTSADGTVLAGTLTVPELGGRFGAVVLVHGSGAQDRDETIGPNKIFQQLSNALSNAGFVVLRYDKRGVGASGGSRSATRDDLLADVRAALGFVRARREVDPRRTYLLGHSEGGELVPTVAAGDPAVAGMVLMAAPALPLWQVSMQQVLASVRPDQRASAEREELDALQKIRESSGSANAWFRSSIDVDPAVDIARGRAPILILQGESDVQVLPSDLPRLVGAARPAHDVTVKTFPGLDHLFEPIPSADAATPQRAVAWYRATPESIDPEVLRTLIGWLRTH